MQISLSSLLVALIGGVNLKVTFAPDGRQCLPGGILGGGDLQFEFPVGDGAWEAMLLGGTGEGFECVLGGGDLPTKFEFPAEVVDMGDGAWEAMLLGGTGEGFECVPTRLSGGEGWSSHSIDGGDIGDLLGVGDDGGSIALPVPSGDVSVSLWPAPQDSGSDGEYTFVTRSYRTWHEENCLLRDCWMLVLRNRRFFPRGHFDFQYIFRDVYYLSHRRRRARPPKHLRFPGMKRIDWLLIKKAMVRNENMRRIFFRMGHRAFVDPLPRLSIWSWTAVVLLKIVFFVVTAIAKAVLEGLSGALTLTLFLGGNVLRLIAIVVGMLLNIIPTLTKHHRQSKSRGRRKRTFWLLLFVLITCMSSSCDAVLQQTTMNRFFQSQPRQLPIQAAAEVVNQDLPQAVDNDAINAVEEGIQAAAEVVNQDLPQAVDNNAAEVVNQDLPEVVNPNVRDAEEAGLDRHPPRMRPLGADPEQHQHGSFWRRFCRSRVDDLPSRYREWLPRGHNVLSEVFQMDAIQPTVQTLTAMAEQLGRRLWLPDSWAPALEDIEIVWGLHFRPDGNGGEDVIRHAFVNEAGNFDENVHRAITEAFARAAHYLYDVNLEVARVGAHTTVAFLNLVPFDGPWHWATTDPDSLDSVQQRTRQLQATLFRHMTQHLPNLSEVLRFGAAALDGMPMDWFHPRTIHTRQTDLAWHPMTWRPRWIPQSSRNYIVTMFSWILSRSMGVPFVDPTSLPNGLLQAILPASSLASPNAVSDSLRNRLIDLVTSCLEMFQRSVQSPYFREGVPQEVWRLIFSQATTEGGVRAMIQTIGIAVRASRIEQFLFGVWICPCCQHIQLGLFGRVCQCGRGTDAENDVQRHTRMPWLSFGLMFICALMDNNIMAMYCGVSGGLRL